MENRKPPFLMRKLSISTAIFNSYVSHYQRVPSTVVWDGMDTHENWIWYGCIWSIQVTTTQYPGHIYLALPDIDCLSERVTGDTSSGWQAFSRFSLYLSYGSITCLGA